MNANISSKFLWLVLISAVISPENLNYLGFNETPHPFKTNNLDRTFYCSGRYNYILL